MKTVTMPYSEYIEMSDTIRSLRAGSASIWEEIKLRKDKNIMITISKKEAGVVVTQSFFASSKPNALEAE